MSPNIAKYLWGANCSLLRTTSQAPHKCSVASVMSDSLQPHGLSPTRVLHNCCYCSVTQSCLTLCNPWTAAHQASPSFTISQSLCKLMSIGSVMPSKHLILCCPLLLLSSVLPSIRVFSVSQLFTSGGQSIGVSASASVLC